MMNKIKANDVKVIPCNGESEYSCIMFISKNDNNDVYITDDGDLIEVNEHDETEYDCIWPDNANYSILAWHYIDGIYGESEESWVNAANDMLGDLHVKLGELHTNSHDEYYDLIASH